MKCELPMSAAPDQYGLALNVHPKGYKSWQVVINLGGGRLQELSATQLVN